jgi:hypothetical protein
MRLNLVDAQQALGFLVEQATHIEAAVYRIAYPEVQYPQLIPVDTSANEWAKSVTFFSLDRVGQAAWFHHAASDMRLADVNRAKFEQGIEMAGIGYRYDLEELGHAMLIPGTNLTIEKADAAHRASEEFIDKVALNGDTQKNWTGLFNNASVTRVDAANDGTGSSRAWTAKTSDLIIRDVNDALTGIYTGSSTVEMADTVLLPIAQMAYLASKRIENTEGNALDWLKKYNINTLQTGQQVTFKGVLGLDTAGAGSTTRMIAYKKDPAVLKMHMPMPHHFLPVWQTGPITFDIPGIFRIGGVEIRRPGAVRYVDQI